MQNAWKYYQASTMQIASKNENIVKMHLLLATLAAPN